MWYGHVCTVVAFVAVTRVRVMFGGPNGSNCVFDLTGFQDTVHCFVILVLTNTSSLSTNY